jgi:lysine/ornithine N-monooxygenase
MSLLNRPEIDVAIVGAGPYGLSIAAHLRALDIPFRIFGQPMLSWQNHMPRGMFLKSEGFASNLYDPQASFTLANYCTELGLPYNDVGKPVPLEVFIAYGLEFQKRLVPELEHTDIQLIKEADPSGGFALETSNGETFQASNVVVAAGITHFGYLPPVLSGHSTEFVTHSYEHADLSRFRDRAVAVVGGGASAIDLAVGLHEAGASVTLIARRSAIAFHEQQSKRSLVQKMLAPRSGLGVGWRSWLCTNAPLVFHSMPASLRIRAVERHLGPAPGWFMKDRAVGRFPFLLGSTISQVRVRDGKVCLTYKDKSQEEHSLEVDHIIGATGYRVEMDRLGFIDHGLLRQIQTLNGSPILDRSFESSVKRLYLTGVAAANSFGPLMRFAYGADFTARRVTRQLAHSVARRPRAVLSGS